MSELFCNIAKNNNKNFLKFFLLYMIIYPFAQTLHFWKAELYGICAQDVVSFLLCCCLLLGRILSPPPTRPSSNWSQKVKVNHQSPITNHQSPITNHQRHLELAENLSPPPQIFFFFLIFFE